MSSLTVVEPGTPPVVLPTDQPGPQKDDAVVTKETKNDIELTDQTNLLPFKKVVAVFGGLALCILVSCLDSTIVATALPSISSHFHAGSIASWVPSAYLLTSTAFQPLCGYSRYYLTVL